MEIQVFNSIYIDPFDGKTYEYTYKDNLSLAEKMLFVSSVVDKVYDGEMYFGFAKDFFIRQAIIAYFTNVKMDEMNGGSDLIEKFVYDTDIVDTVMEDMSNGVIAELEKAIDENIQIKTGIKKRNLEDAIIEVLDKMSSKVDEIDVQTLLSFMKKLADTQGEFTPEQVLNAYMNTDMFKQNAEERASIAKERQDKIIQFAKENVSENNQ